MMMIDNETDCLLIIDVQNDFCAGGALAVPDADAVIPVINRLTPLFAHRLLTQDWHPPGHQSFASNHPGKEPFSTIQMPYGEQVLWPDHCVWDTPGAAFRSGLDTAGTELVLRKGFCPSIDSYSAFFENDHTTPTGLAGYLRNRGFSRVFMGGLATDFCVAYSALDARAEEFDVFLLEDACRGLNMENSLAEAWAKMEAAGVQRITSDALAG